MRKSENKKKEEKKKDGAEYIFVFRVEKSPVRWTLRDKRVRKQDDLTDVTVTTLPSILKP